MCAPSQWETTLQCIVVSHCLSARAEWSMCLLGWGHLCYGRDNSVVANIKYCYDGYIVKVIFYDNHKFIITFIRKPVKLAYFDKALPDLCRHMMFQSKVSFSKLIFYITIDGRNSSALAMGLVRLSCTNPSKWCQRDRLCYEDFQMQSSEP